MHGSEIQINKSNLLKTLDYCNVAKVRNEGVVKFLSLLKESLLNKKVDFEALR